VFEAPCLPTTIPNASAFRGTTERIWTRRKEIIRQPFGVSVAALSHYFILYFIIFYLKPKFIRTFLTL
jgi:hypothetical protein